MKKILFYLFSTIFLINSSYAVSYCVYDPDITEVTCTAGTVSGPVWTSTCTHLDKSFDVIGIGWCGDQYGLIGIKDDSKYCNCLMLSPKNGGALKGIKTYTNADECIPNCATECRSTFVNNTEKRRLLWL